MGGYTQQYFVYAHAINSPTLPLPQMSKFQENHYHSPSQFTNNLSLPLDKRLPPFPPFKMSHQRKPTLQPVSSPVLPQEAEQETKRSKKETSEELTEAIQKLDTTDNNEQQRKTTTTTLASSSSSGAGGYCRVNRGLGGFVFSDAFFEKAERRWDCGCGVEYSRRSMGQENSNGMMGKGMNKYKSVHQTVDADGDTQVGNVGEMSKKVSF